VAGAGAQESAVQIPPATNLFPRYSLIGTRRPLGRVCFTCGSVFRVKKESIVIQVPLDSWISLGLESWRALTTEARAKESAVPIRINEVLAN